MRYGLNREHARRSKRALPVRDQTAEHKRQATIANLISSIYIYIINCSLILDQFDARKE
jgi:hypothetical protein